MTDDTTRFIAFASKTPSPEILYLRHWSYGWSLRSDVLDLDALRLAASRMDAGDCPYIYVYKLEIDRISDFIHYHSPTAGWIDYVPHRIVHENGKEHPDEFKSRQDAMAFAAQQPFMWGVEITQVSDTLSLNLNPSLMTVQMDGGKAVAWRVMPGFHRLESGEPPKWEWQLWEDEVQS